MKTVLETRALGFPWETVDPFLFCVHHEEMYPPGTEDMGPPPEMLVGRPLGNDFGQRDGWRMYHGEKVPGFPAHPHRGFETVTIVRRGFIDHSDSLGATARFGAGDVQWLTTGAGIVHAEMFPLIERAKPNPLELFQIWLNLPASDKLAEPHFAMLWNEEVPRCSFVDAAGRTTLVTVAAGELDGKRPPPPPPHSWAARGDSDLAIWTIEMQPGATWTLPPARGTETVRTLYLFRGDGLRVDTDRIGERTGAVVVTDRPVELAAGDAPVDVLLLQARPIGEPVANYGPFVMNTRAELEKAIMDYQRTRFGGWPWNGDAPVHPRDAGRFAKHADGRIEHAGTRNG